MSLYLAAEAPWPSGVHAVVTTRQAGYGLPPYAGLNLALHVQDDPQRVADNRALLQQTFAWPHAPCWLQQVHGIQAVAATPGGGMQADACYTQTPGLACAVMTADCLPLLIASADGQQVAAVHAGWRGLLQGVIAATLARFDTGATSPLVWLGPAISAAAYEVDQPVYEACAQVEPGWLRGFQPTRPGHYQLDLYAVARMQLADLGVSQVYGGDYCSYRQAEYFYSYRRDGVTGRMASLIWREPGLCSL